MNFVLRIIITAVVAFALSYILKGIHINEFTTALLLALVLALLNAFLKPLLIILTLPITIVTFGLFLFVINALIIMLASEFIDGFKVDGFWWALLFSLLLSTLTSLLYKKEGGQKEKKNN
ncbi:MAG TPA: phage holin family protein [Puia sp.]|nr:phage holin family protein [Puia sp.]